MMGREEGPAPEQGTGAMMADVLAGVSRLVQGELALARAETAERLQSAKHAAVQVVVAVVLGITAINLLAAALVAAIIEMGLSPIWASVLVGVALLLLAMGSAQAAARLLRDAGKMPRRTLASVKQDMETLQTMVRPDATS
jgi:uncharacterized membrane protein YeiB